MTEQLRVDHLFFGYPGVPLFEDFGFSSSASRILIRGPSGCGKTTLLKIFSGVLAVPSTASIIAESSVFIVLQSDGLIPWLTGTKNIEMFGQALLERVKESLLFSLIEEFVERRACDMSYGQRRSVELVRALLSQRRLLLLDEPLNFLDRQRRSVFLDYMRDEDACRSQIVMTSHYEDGLDFPDKPVFEFSGDAPFQRLTAVACADL
jgi:ABC-type multidrug transport system ATPase subunit